jgi:hypothetical protein
MVYKNLIQPKESFLKQKKSQVAFLLHIPILKVKELKIKELESLQKRRFKHHQKTIKGRVKNNFTFFLKTYFLHLLPAGK